MHCQAITVINSATWDHCSGRHSGIRGKMANSQVFRKSIFSQTQIVMDARLKRSVQLQNQQNDRARAPQSDHLDKKTDEPALNFENTGSGVFFWGGGGSWRFSEK